MSSIESVYGAQLNREQPLREYPRPQLVRDSYLSLNGVWQYAITDNDNRPEACQGDILVPFSPESPLSGVQRTLRPGQTLWYRLRITLAADFVRERVLLHFGAVDQSCTVYLNGWSVGSNQGGYLPFCFDITDFLVEGEQELEIKVTDSTDTGPLAHSRQKLNHGGVWHTPQSGIWQTVWMESVARQHIKSLRVTPLFEEAAVEVEAESGGSDFSGTALVLAQDQVVAQVPFTTGETLRITIPDAIAWHPDAPFLYALRLESETDTVHSYFGLRKFSVEPGADGRGRLMLNNEPFFIAGVLDQGLYSDGLYTAPTEEAMVEDIRFAKACGFNLIRKHGKIEPLRWYYHCDRLGLLVWQDLPAAGHDAILSESEKLSLRLFHTGDQFADANHSRFGRESAEGRQQYHTQMERAAALLYSTPSLMAWVLFQSGQGQFNAAEAAEKMRQLDPTRLVDHASGRYDQGAGDILSLHTYNLGAVALPEEADPRAAVITECGGFGYSVAGHFIGTAPHAVQLVYTKQQLAEAIATLYQQQLMPLAGQGICGFIYAQLSDAGDEVSGLLTADRAEQKIHPKGMATLNSLVMEGAARPQPPQSDDQPQPAAEPQPPEDPAPDQAPPQADIADIGPLPKY